MRTRTTPRFLPRTWRLSAALTAVLVFIAPQCATWAATEGSPHAIKRLRARSLEPTLAARILFLSTGRRLERLAHPKNVTVKTPRLPSQQARPFRAWPSTEYALPALPTASIRPLSLTVVERLRGYDELIRRYSEIHDVDPNLIRAVIYVESAGRSSAVSHKGAQGLMQLMPQTAHDMGVSNALDPAQNIYGGTRYLANLLDRFKRPEIALWGYNAGPEAVKRRRLPLETKRYIPEVMRVKAILEQQGT